MTKLVRPRDLANYGFDMSEQRRKQLEGEGKFPRRVRLVPGSRGAYGYCEDELLEHIELLRLLRDADPRAK
jgi:hypothetical protein